MEEIAKAIVAKADVAVLSLLFVNGTLAAVVFAVVRFMAKLRTEDTKATDAALHKLTEVITDLRIAVAERRTSR